MTIRPTFSFWAESTRTGQKLKYINGYKHSNIYTICKKENGIAHAIPLKMRQVGQRNQKILYTEATIHTLIGIYCMIFTSKFYIFEPTALYSCELEYYLAVSLSSLHKIKSGLNQPRPFFYTVAI